MSTLSLSPWCYLTRCMHPAFPVVFLFWKQLINWTIPWCNGKPCGNVSWANNKPYSNSSSSQARTQKISHLAPQYSQWSCLYNSQAQRIPGISARCEKKSPHTSGLKEGTWVIRLTSHVIGSRLIQVTGHYCRGSSAMHSNQIQLIHKDPKHRALLMNCTIFTPFVSL